MRNTLLILVAVFTGCPLATAQRLVFSQPHGFYTSQFLLTISSEEGGGADIRYTLDGSEPTAQGNAYSQPLLIKGNTIIRAVALGADGQPTTPVATATYLFPDDVLRQGNSPEGYPAQWGSYSTIWGTATADYEMDPEMTRDPALMRKIRAGLTSLPALSIVTDRDNLFSHENDSLRGGIYIFTGPPQGDATGHGWTRPASAELFGADGNKLPGEGFSVTCGLRLHGGHGRMAEKNPKHSLRLVFKKEYGEKTLQYPLYGEDEPAKFDQLVLRCHFGHSWQHWDEGNRQKAQYTRDVWARRMQRKMGHTAVNALYVNLFINGMYWGIYNLSERVDDQYGKDHLGGSKSDIDVIKIEEDGGNHLEATEGDMLAWQQLVQTAAEVAAADAADDEAYLRLQGLGADGLADPQAEPLLDVDQFIDYMLINQYVGNDDWDHHNWYAVRRRGAESQGFRFLCWDSESILLGENDNVTGKNSGNASPTGIFHNLLHNESFARRYLHRAKEVLAPDGLLGQESVVQLWDSLYNTISSALYAEAARWGDYRRDVHPWQARGQLYTVDGTYMAERRRLLNQYFPVRTERVLSQVKAIVGIDDFDMPQGWQRMTAQMFHRWTGSGADAQPLEQPISIDWALGQQLSNGAVVAGQSAVDHDVFADLSAYDYIVLRGRGNGLRLLANRLVAHGPWKQLVVSFNDGDPYWDDELQAVVVPLEQLRTMNTTSNEVRRDPFLHLNALKVDWGQTATVSGIYLVPSAQHQDIGTPPSLAHRQQPGVYYDLQGRRVGTTVSRPGLYLLNGRKVLVK